MATLVKGERSVNDEEKQLMNEVESERQSGEN